MRPGDPEGRVTAFLSSSETRAETEIKKGPKKLETMLRLIIERHVGGDRPLPDEAEAIRTSDEIVDLDEVKKSLLERS